MSKYFLDLLTLKTEMNYRGYSEATKKSYTQIVGNFLEVTDKEIINITKEDVVRYLDENMKLLKKNSRAVHLNALEFFFEEVLGLDITVSIKNYKREFLEKTFMTLEQFNILSNSVTEKERLIYEIIKETGFKIKDIVNLKVEDIVYGDKSYIGIHKISKELSRDIQKYCDKEMIDGKIFNVCEYSIRRWNKKATENYLGVEYQINDIRHALALELYIKRGDEEGAVKYLGLKTVEALRQYYTRTGNKYYKK